MTVSLWRIGSDTKDYEATDLSGAGAQKTGGRWNRTDTPVVYASSTIALACLETVVHVGVGQLPLNRFLVRIEVPDRVWKDRQVLLPNDLPVGWSAIPEGKVSIEIGDVWLRSLSSALLLVPSVIVPEEMNVLLNPRHSDAEEIAAQKARAFLYDGRLLTKSLS